MMLVRDLFNELPVSDNGPIPLMLHQLLREPLDVYTSWQRAERVLLDAQRMMPERLEVPVALYKMYAYSNRFDQALELISEVLQRAAVQAGFSHDWRLLDHNSADWLNASGAVRFYLYSLKALGFVLLRKAEVDLAYEVLQKLCVLDASDQVGGSVVFEIAQRLLDSDEVEVVN